MRSNNPSHTLSRYSSTQLQLHLISGVPVNFQWFYKVNMLPAQKNTLCSHSRVYFLPNIQSVTAFSFAFFQKLIGILFHIHFIFHSPCTCICNVCFISVLSLNSISWSWENMCVSTFNWSPQSSFLWLITLAY
jgi:hypothetical protein